MECVDHRTLSAMGCVASYSVVDGSGGTPSTERGARTDNKESDCSDETRRKSLGDMET